MVGRYPENVDVREEVQKFIKSTGIASKGGGDEFILRYCPFCGGGSKKDKDSFSINMTTGQYQCKRSSCGEQGNLWTLTKDARFTYALPDPEKKSIKKHIHRFSTNVEDDERAAKWILENRGIPEEVTKKYNVRFGTEVFKSIYNMDGNMVLSSPEKCLVWQFTDTSGEKTLFYKFRKTEGSGSKEWCISKDFQYDDGKYHVEPCLYGMGECDYKDDFVIMTEGQFDTLAVAAAGFGNVVSVPTGAKGMNWFDDENNDESRNFLKRFGTLIIFGDREGDNVTLLHEMLERFKGRIKCVRLEDYKDCKDANDILKKYGAEQIRQCVLNASLIPIKGIKKMKDVKKINMSNLERIKTGIPTLDKNLLGFFFGQVITITGKSGDGKTTLSSQFVANAIDQNVPVVIYSGEFPEWMIKNWLVLQLAGPSNIKNTQKGVDIEQEIWEKIDNWAPFGENCHIYSADVDLEDEEEKTSLLDSIQRAIVQYGVRFVVIDNLMTAMEFSDESDLNKSQSAFMKQLKKMAMTYEVIVLVIAHPKKMQTYKGATITKDDIAGSSNIGNLSDTIISYSKPTSENSDYDREITILKNRWNSDKGVGDAFGTYFNEASKRISENKGFFDWDFGWNAELLPWERKEEVI